MVVIKWIFGGGYKGNVGGDIKGMFGGAIKGVFGGDVWFHDSLWYICCYSDISALLIYSISSSWCHLETQFSN